MKRTAVMAAAVLAGALSPLPSYATVPIGSGCHWGWSRMYSVVPTSHPSEKPQITGWGVTGKTQAECLANGIKADNDFHTIHYKTPPYTATIKTDQPCSLQCAAPLPGGSNGL